MASLSLADQVLTGAWVDLTVALPALSAANATIQNVGSTPVAISWGADPSGGGISGLVLGPRESCSGTAANVYAKAIGNSGRISVTTS